MLKLYDLSINAVKNPLFVPCSPLYVGWKLQSDNTHVLQSTCTATITRIGYDTPAWRHEGTRQSIHIPVDVVLDSRTDYLLTVTVTDNHGESATASLPFFTALNPTDWDGQWIKPRRHVDGWAPYLRTKFTAEGSIRSARLYVCGLGCGEYYINGQKICEDMIDPPFTNYEREVFYRAYDVTALLGEKNAFAALLGEGWYAQSRVWGSCGMQYGAVCLLAQLEILYENGEKQTIVTNTEDWSYQYSPIVLNNLYGGETYDTRLEIPDFADVDGSEDGWSGVVEDTTPRGELKLCMMPPVRVIRSFPAVSVKQVSGQSDGAWIVDFGENVAGFAEIRIPNSPRGAQVTLRFAETLNPDGTLDHRSVGSFATQCVQQDIYVARGDSEGETWRPRFTYHGFRYMEITGYHDLRSYGSNPEPSMFTAHVLSTDLTRAGHFQSACADLDHLQAVMMSTFRSNYHGFPEDCPAREKCGWLGDAQVVCNTGIMNYDMEASYEKYVHDMRTEDEVYGVWQMIAPGKRGCGEATPLWGCANVVIPYWMYHYYGNDAIVKSHWDQMEKWMRHEIDDAERTSGDFIITRGIGDWCPPVGHASERRIPIVQSSTAIFYEIACMMQELAQKLGLPTAVDYGDLAIKIKESFNRHFWLAEEHRYSTWAACGVALKTGLYPEGEHDALVAALVKLMEEDDYAMSSGIYGNKYLVPALAEEGYGDLAMKFLFTRDHVSFGTMLDDGATSLWECLEMKNIGMPRELAVSSYNHPMHAGFAYFLYAHVGGIKPLTPGFPTFEISPADFTDIPSATVSHICPFGEIRVDFVREDDTITYTVTVPANTVGYFRKGGLDVEMGSGVHTLRVPH